MSYLPDRRPERTASRSRNPAAGGTFTESIYPVSSQVTGYVTNYFPIQNPMTKHDNNGELSCFKSALLFYLRESHPHMADDKAFIRERADSAAEAYEHAIRDGLSVRQALEQADAVLYQDLRFSRFDTVFEAVSEWFPEVRPERRTDFCLKVLSPAAAVFGKYSIDDRFESSPACHTLTVELTGFIQSYIEQYGI